MDNSGPVEFIPAVNEEEVQTCVYANGVKLEMRGSNLTKAPIVFYGKEGWIGLDREKLIAEPASLLLKPPEVRLCSSAAHQDDFLQCVRSQCLPICPPEVGHRSASVCQFHNISHRQRRP